jgi:hypothetical protein
MSKRKKPTNRFQKELVIEGGFEPPSPRGHPATKGQERLPFRHSTTDVSENRNIVPPNGTRSRTFLYLKIWWEWRESNPHGLSTTGS